MKTSAAFTIVGLAACLLAGQAQAMPAASLSTAGIAEAPIVHVATIVTTRTVRPATAVVTRRVVRRGPLGGGIVTTTRTVR